MAFSQVAQVASIEAMINRGKQVTQPDSKHPPLDAVLFTLRSFLQPTRLWQDTEIIINLFAHVELKRRAIVTTAQKAIQSGTYSPRICQNLMKLADVTTNSKRRKFYWETILSLCKSHIQYHLCVNDAIVPVLMMKYFPDLKDLSAPQLAMHLHLSEDEKISLVNMRRHVLHHLKEVAQKEEREWSNPSWLHAAGATNRERYIETYGDPFHRGEADLGEIVCEFARVVENHSKALEKLLAHH